MPERTTAMVLQAFEGKDESELEALCPPPGLPTLRWPWWQKERQAAIRRVREASQQVQQQAELAIQSQTIAQLTPADGPAQAGPEALDKKDVAPPQEESVPASAGALETRSAASQSSVTESPVSEVLAPVRRSFTLPQGDAAQLLERQLASGAAMVSEVARQFVEDEFPASVWIGFMKGVSSLIGASASAAKTIGLLRAHAGTIERRPGGATPLQTNGA